MVSGMLPADCPVVAPLTSVLIVDDEPGVRDLMARWVTSLGLRPRTAASAAEALATLRVLRYDLAVIDVMMPGHNGLWLAGQLRRDHPNTAVVIATAHPDMLEADALAPPIADLPIADLLIKPFPRERFALAVDRGRQWRKLALEAVRWHAVLSLELRDRVAEICGMLEACAADGTSQADALWAYAQQRIPDTMAHAERVARYAQSVARELGASSPFGADLELAARFHDIGKAAMPTALLSKPSCLTPGEMAIMRQHVEAGAKILEAAAALVHIASTVRASHEWFGGGGYPLKLAGTGIPLASRIIGVTDAYDAMTHDRAYRAGFDGTDAIAELLRHSPAQFDPDVVTAFLAVLGRH